jgi:hypothetical protein
MTEITFQREDDLPRLRRTNYIQSKIILFECRYDDSEQNTEHRTQQKESSSISIIMIMIIINTHNGTSPALLV